MNVEDIGITELYTTIADFMIRYAFQILGALVILGIGAIFARWLSNFIIKLCEKRKIDPMLARFFGGAAKIIVLIFIAIVALGKFGISIGPMVAALGALTLGASFAVQGLVSNYASGLSIIIARPFTIGHTITVKGMRGVVDEVLLSRTELLTEEGERILIPNKHIVGEIITNSAENSLAELTLGISYGDDPEKAVSVISTVMSTFETVRKDPAPQIGISEFADSAINLGVRYWAPTSQYFQTQYAVNMAVYKAVQDAGITRPFPQRDVNVNKQEG